INSMSRASARVGFSPTRWNGARKMPNFIPRCAMMSPQQRGFVVGRRRWHESSTGGAAPGAPAATARARAPPGPRLDTSTRSQYDWSINQFREVRAMQDAMTNVAGEPLSPESRRMRAYLHERAVALAPREIEGRVRAAMGELDLALRGADEAHVRAHPIAGEWSLAQIVDHVAQPQIRAADELRHLLAGRRPPAPPVYEALTSGAAQWAPWAELLEGLASANGEMLALLSAPAASGAGRAAESGAA